MITNLILKADSYKYGMFLMMPPGTEYQYSYIESRGGKWDKTLFFGLQMLLKDLEDSPITMDDVEEADALMEAHGEPFNRAGWDYIVTQHGGRLPISIWAVPEGMVIPGKNILVMIVNTDPACFWLSSWMETMMVRAVWFPTTVATGSFQSKLALMAALEKSCDNPAAEIAYKLHDFAGRGVSSSESAQIGGAAHLVNFMGTDTVEGLYAAHQYYTPGRSIHARFLRGTPALAHSIPAAEHSTVTSWGKEHEVDSYKNMLDRFLTTGKIVAVVSDSYDIFNAVLKLWGGVLKDQIINSGGTLVIRPDSGDPLTLPIRIIELLGTIFGFTVNSKGFRVLPSYVRVIQGDGITHASIPLILANLLTAGWSAENLNFGMGGGLLQHLNRDDLKFAMKCSAIRVEGEWRDVFKDPITDPGKKSKRGRLMLVMDNTKGLTTVPWDDARVAAGENILVEVFRDGFVTVDQAFGDIRGRAHEEALKLSA